jgi:hypothetical protein
MLLSMSRRERMRARATAALGVLKAFSVGVPGGFTAKLDVEAASGTADSGDPERDLAVLLVEVGQVAQSGGTGALLFLDEMQALDATALAAVCRSMNRVGQRGLPVALVGAGLPPLPRLLRAAKPYAERMFAYHAEARMALVAPRRCARSSTRRRRSSWSAQPALLQGSLRDGLRRRAALSGGYG